MIYHLGNPSWSCVVVFLARIARQLISSITVCIPDLIMSLLRFFSRFHPTAALREHCFQVETESERPSTFVACRYGYDDSCSSRGCSPYRSMCHHCGDRRRDYISERPYAHNMCSTVVLTLPHRVINMNNHFVSPQRQHQRAAALQHLQDALVCTFSG